MAPTFTDSFRVEMAHVIASEGFRNASERVQTGLSDLGLKRNAHSNIKAVFSEQATVDAIQDGNSQTRSFFDGLNGWLLGRHDSTAPGGNHPNMNQFQMDQFEMIFDPDNGLSPEARRLAVFDVIRFSERVIDRKAFTEGGSQANLLGSGSDRATINSAFKNERLFKPGDLTGDTLPSQFEERMVAANEYYSDYNGTESQGGSNDPEKQDKQARDNARGRAATEVGKAAFDQGYMTDAEYTEFKDLKNRSPSLAISMLGEVANRVLDIGLDARNAAIGRLAARDGLINQILDSDAFQKVGQKFSDGWSAVEAVRKELGVEIPELTPEQRVDLDATLRAISKGAGAADIVGSFADLSLNTFDTWTQGLETDDYSAYWGEVGYEIAFQAAVAAAAWAALKVAAKKGIPSISFISAGLQILGAATGIKGAADLIEKASQYIIKSVGADSTNKEIWAAYEYMFENKDGPVADNIGLYFTADDLDPNSPWYVPGGDTADVIYGRNGAIISGRGGGDELHHSGYGAMLGGDGNDYLFALRRKSETEAEVPPSNIEVNGGAGNDVIIATGGIGGTFIGGVGRDVFFVAKRGAVIFGDTIDGNRDNAKGVPIKIDRDSSEQADLFWWWPAVTVMDPGKSDQLRFFGYPMVGGSNEVPGVNLGPLSSFGGTGFTYNSPLFFDYLMPFMTYYQIEDKLYVNNLFKDLFNSKSVQKFGGPDGVSIRGSMVFNGYDDRESVLWGIQFSKVSGDLGMTFRIANPFLSLFALFPGFPGGINRFLPMIDTLLGYRGALIKVAKALRWDDMADPLILDLDGDGIETVDIESSNIYFDNDGDFFAERTGWLSGDDGFLALDHNENGKIDDISELFGNVGLSGFAELAQFDLNNDGRIDIADVIYADLKVWQDHNQDGASSDDEITSLSDLGIISISLETNELQNTTPQGAFLERSAQFEWESGEFGNLFDAIFESSDVDTRFAGDSGVATWLGDQPINSKGFGRIADLVVGMSNDFDLANTVASAAAAMTMPDLKQLRALSGEALGQWGFALELTRELVPVLLDGDGLLVDRGIYFEDSEGGYWGLSSGDIVFDTNNIVIDRPGLQDILAQSSEWVLQQVFSPSTRANAVAHRDNAPYLVEIVDGRAVILDYGVQSQDGTWSLASGLEIRDENGLVVSEPSVADIRAMPFEAGQEWRVEEIGLNPFAVLPVSEIGVNFVDGVVVDYTVLVTDENGSFHVWARNLDRAIELQEKFDTPRDFVLRNFEVDFETLDEVGSTDDSTLRVEILTPAQFHFATSLSGIDFQPQLLFAEISAETGIIDYAVNEDGQINLSDVPGEYESGIEAIIELLQPVMEQYILASRSFAVRLASQGGLSDFFADFSYDVAADGYIATTDRELAPVFERIFEAMPEGYDAAYDYLAEWNLILAQIYPDYKTNGDYNQFGTTVTVDQRLIFQMMIPAFEGITTDLDLAAAMNALSVNETLLVAHDADATAVDGTSGQDFIYITGGDQIYRGGVGKDVYFVGSGFGVDEIYDVDFGNADELRFTDVKSTEVIASRVGQDLILAVEGRSDLLTVRDHFLGELNPGFGKTVQESDMKAIVFADGVVWDSFRIAYEVADPRDSDDVIIGSGSLDVMWGGKGNDILRGSAGGDLYIFERGDGQDVIADSNAGSTGVLKGGLDFLQFQGDITADDLLLRRDGESVDLQVYLLDENGAQTGDRIYIEQMFDGMRLNLGAFLGDLDPSLGIDYVATNIIEKFIFDNGTSLDFAQISERVIAEAATDGEDAIYGFLQANTLDGGAGDDLLVGREGGDTYIFGAGYGLDILEDEDLSVKLFGAPDDTLRFTDDLRWTDFDYIREGSSDTLTMMVSGTDDGVIFKDNLRTGVFQGFINLIEKIEFDDGTVWDYTQLLQTYIDQAKTDGDDTIYGFLTADTLDGGMGNDRLEGFGGADTYIYGQDYGDDVVVDIGSGDGTQIIQDTVFEDVDSIDFANSLIERLNSTGDTLVMQDIAYTDVTVSRSGLDLIFTVDATGASLTIEGQYFRANAQGRAIESFVFTDRVVQFTQLNPEDVDRIGTNANETLDGSNFAETLDGRGGDDILIGASDGDTYLFDAGYGQDTIIDTQVQAAWAGRKGKEIETEDRVLFGDDVTFETAKFSKDGLDLLIRIDNYTDTLRIKNQFRDTTDGVELFQFQSGQIITIADVEERLQIEGGNRGDNVLVGTPDQPNVLDGRQGDDQLFGGSEEDTYSFGIGYDFDTIIEVADVAGKIDTVVFGAGVRSQNLILRRNGDDLLIDLGNGQDVLTIAGGLGATTVEAFRFADGEVLTIDALRDQMLLGTSGADQIIGFDGRDDVINGGAGSDALVGGTGDDTYQFGFGDGQDSIEETGGVDRIEFGDGLTRGDVSFDDVDGDLLITITETGDTLVVLNGAILSPTSGHVETFVFADGETLTLNDVRQTIFLMTPNGSSDYVEAGLFDADYQVSPGAGFDTVIMATGTQYLFNQGDGIDRVVMPVSPGDAEIIFTDLGTTDAVVKRANPTSTDLLVTFPETGDVVRLVSGFTKTNLLVISFADGINWDRAALLAAVVDGQITDSDDLLTGTVLADNIDAGLGDDDLQGGAGDDIYTFTRGDGADLIADTSGVDTLNIFGYLPTEVSVTRPVQGRDDVVLSFAGTDDEITLRYVSLSGVDAVVFTDGTTWSRDDLFVMSVGQGTEFDDVIAGSAEADTIEGGRGDDDMRGAAGDDTYLVNLGDGDDVILDYATTNSGTDRVILRDFAPDQITLQGTPKDIVIVLPDGGSVRLQDQRDGNADSQIEEIAFANGIVWGLPDINAALTADMRESGTVVGTASNDIYTHTQGDGSYTISDEGRYNKGDRLVLTDVNSDQISVVVDGRDIVLTLPNAEEIRLLEMAEGSRYYWGVRYVDFADDTTFTLTDLANPCSRNPERCGPRRCDRNRAHERNLRPYAGRRVLHDFR